MPTYDYECPDCGHAFEEMQSISAKPLRKCPKCGKRRVKRLIGMGAGLIFKGSGFYLTDYARKGGDTGSEPQPETKGDAKAESKPEATTESKSEPKPQPKAEAKPQVKPTKPRKPGK